MYFMVELKCSSLVDTDTDADAAHAEEISATPYDDVSRSNCIFQINFSCL